MADGSVFGDEAIWTLQNVQELSEACSGIESMASDDETWSWLKTQLQGKRPEVIRLAAEAVWLIYLYPTTTEDAPTWKRDRLSQLWNYLAPTCPIASVWATKRYMAFALSTPDIGGFTSRCGFFSS